MNSKRQCPRCGREVDDTFQFCPFDATPLSKTCPTCGKSWDAGFQFCPLDSTPLGVGASAAAPPAPAPPATARVEPAPPPVRPAPPPVAAPRPAPAAPPVVPAPDAAFAFIEQAATPAWKQVLFRPLTYLFALGLIGVGFAVWYLNYRTGGPDLPTPTVSYSLLPNEGKSKGLPVAIKINQLTVFMIDDPTDSPEGASRAKSVVKTLEDAIRPLKADSGGVRFAVDDQRPLILEIMQESGERRQLAEVTAEDATLAGEKDPQRLAAEWAKRLTDAVNLFVFGTAPNFSTDSDFGQALLAMYKAALSDRGKISKRSLDDAYQKLTAGQKQALEAPPVARRSTAAL